MWVGVAWRGCFVWVVGYNLCGSGGHCLGVGILFVWEGIVSLGGLVILRFVLRAGNCLVVLGIGCVDVVYGGIVCDGGYIYCLFGVASFALLQPICSTAHHIFWHNNCELRFGTIF